MTLSKVWLICDGRFRLKASVTEVSGNMALRHHITGANLSGVYDNPTGPLPFESLPFWGWCMWLILYKISIWNWMELWYSRYLCCLIIIMKYGIENIKTRIGRNWFFDCYYSEGNIFETDKWLNDQHNGIFYKLPNFILFSSVIAPTLFYINCFL